MYFMFSITSYTDSSNEAIPTGHTYGRYHDLMYALLGSSNKQQQASVMTVTVHAPVACQPGVTLSYTQ